MSKVINHTDLTKTLGLTECTNGFWLYDKTRGMNLAMREDTCQYAYVKALTYYQRRLIKVEGGLKHIKTKVESFVSEFVDDEDFDLF